jgi:hypothetical protein
VTISLRAVSVNTGKVLTSVTVQKTILSTADSLTALKFFDNATQSFEAEAGLTINEPGTYAVKAATEMAVVELIKEGQRKGVWDFKPEISLKTEPPAISFIPAPPAPVIASELKKKEEEKKEEEKKEEKTEEKKDKAPSTQEVPADLKPVVVTEPGSKMPKEVTLSEAQYIYKDMNEKSQKTWMFKKGTLVMIVNEYGDWIEVRDAEKRKGFVKKDVLVNKQQ